MMLVARALERIGDNAVDIGEQVAFVVTGLFREFSDASQPRLRRSLSGPAFRRLRGREQGAHMLERPVGEAEVREQPALLAGDEARVEQLLEVVADRRLLQAQLVLNSQTQAASPPADSSRLTIFTRWRSARALNTRSSSRASPSVRERVPRAGRSIGPGEARSWRQCIDKT